MPEFYRIDYAVGSVRESADFPVMPSFGPLGDSAENEQPALRFGGLYRCLAIFRALPRNGAGHIVEAILRAKR
jgi:hypothetical protein